MVPSRLQVGVLALIAACGLHLVASQSPDAQGGYSILMQTTSKFRSTRLFDWYKTHGAFAPTDLNLIVPPGTNARAWFGDIFNTSDADAVHEFTSDVPKTDGKTMTLRVIEASAVERGFSPLAKYLAVETWADQSIVMLQDDKMKVDESTASVMSNVVSQKDEDPLFAGLYPRYIRNVTDSERVEFATGGQYDTGLVYKTESGAKDKLPFQMLKGRVFVINNLLGAVKNFTDWVQAKGAYTDAYNESVCESIGGPFAGLNTAFELVERFPFCDDISFQYFTQIVRPGEINDRVSQSWVKECPELEKFPTPPGGIEDKTVCLQGMNCLLGYQPWEDPLYTRGTDPEYWGFGKNVGGDTKDDEVVDPVDTGVC